MAPRRGYAAGLTRRKDEKTDNHQAAQPLKVALRREALERIQPATVLDCFAGRGMMHTEVWHDAEGYLGNDKEITQVLAHPAPCHHMEAGTLLRAIDLQRFNVFDLDAYGSPWVEVTILAARRRLLPGEEIALVITDGAARRAMLGLTAYALAQLAGERPDAVGAHRRWTQIVGQALREAARRMGGSLTVLRVAADGGAGGVGARGMFYGLAILRGLPGGQAAPGQGVAAAGMTPPPTAPGGAA